MILKISHWASVFASIAYFVILKERVCVCESVFSITVPLFG